MSQLNVDKTKFILQYEEFEFNELFSSSFYKKSDKLASDYNNNSFVVNELFLNIIQPSLAIDHFINEHNVNCINFRDANNQLKLFLSDIALKNKTKVQGTTRFVRIKTKGIAHFQILISTIYLLYLMLRIPFSEEVETTANPFSVIRDKKAKAKMKRFDFHKEFEDPKSINSIYRLTKKSIRVKWVIKSWWKSYRKIRDYSNLVKDYLGENSSANVYSFYGKRIVHMLLYHYVLDDYFRKRKGYTFYTGNNLDRFSVIEEQLAAKYSIETICIPHGLEYGFKLPKGFSCSKFYATSSYAAEYLNNLYKSEKFVFDYEVTQKMFMLESQNTSKGKKVIFFTEPREVEVNRNILTELVPLMNKINVKLYLKLHPFDNPANYAQFELDIVSNYEEALIGNICFARKSTVLIEAIYNNSIPAAIITTPKDASIFNTMPSLQTKQIELTRSVPELFQWICKNLNQTA